VPQRETHRHAGLPWVNGQILAALQAFGATVHRFPRCLLPERLPGVERETKAELDEKNERFPVVHVHGGSAIVAP
jgi:hypothetical protein